MEDFARQLRENETWLMERVLSYARRQDYTRYTSTLLKAWQVSIAGLTEAVALACEAYGERLPEFRPGEDLADDPVASFGVEEARRHRERGISLEMFLGLNKYYREAYLDLVGELGLSPERRAFRRAFVTRCFDRIEIAFCVRWAEEDGNRTMHELQRANRRMTNEKNKYLTVFESLDVPAFLVDGAGVVDNLNAAAVLLLGREGLEGEEYYSGDAPLLRSRRLAELLPRLGALVDDWLHGPEASFREEFAEGGPDERVYVVTFSRMCDVSGKFRGGIVLLDDVTEQRRMERLKEDVDRMMRHDLKVPLSGMLGVLDALLDEGERDPERRELLRLGQENGYAMLEMINNSLNLYRMETGSYRLQAEPVDLVPALRRVVERLGVEARGRRVTVDCEDVSDAGPSGGLAVLGDALLLHSALGNLLKNALEASPRGGRVRVAVREERGSCRVILENAGEVPEEVRERFFEKYVTSGKRDGTGLGAYSARLMVETMGGFVRMRTGDGRTEVVLALPRAGGAGGAERG